MAAVNGELRIISRYSLVMSRERCGADHIADNSLLWDYESGEKLENLGELEKVRKFRAPSADKELCGGFDVFKEYDME